jgi:CheY-like chemotaxis protein
MPQALIVDDDEFIRLLFTDTLEMAHFDCITASTASDAIKKLQNVTPNIAFIDYNMPGGTGTQVIEFIRETPRLSSVKVVVVTANALAEKMVEDLGIDLFLEKPVSPADIIAFAQRLTA